MQERVSGADLIVLCNEREARLLRDSDDVFRAVHAAHAVSETGKIE